MKNQKPSRRNKTGMEYAKKERTTSTSMGKKAAAQNKANKSKSGKKGCK